MELEKAIEQYNKLSKNNIVKSYHKALSVVLEHTRKTAERVFYKSSKKYDYYIELPYEKLEITTNGAEYIKHSYSAIGVKNGHKDYSLNFCLSLCNYTEDDIKKSIDRHIIADND